MKNQTIKDILYAMVMVSMVLSAMDAESAARPHMRGRRDDATYSIVVTKENIQEYVNTIQTFLDKRRGQMATLRSSNPFTRFGISLYGSYNGIDMDEARGFLERAFEDEAALQETLASIGTDEESVAYLKQIMAEIDSRSIAKKDSSKLPEIMRTHKHPSFKGIEKPWVKEKLPDDKEFLRGAACSFLAYHLLESDGPAHEVITRPPLLPHNSEPVLHRPSPDDV